MTQPTGGRPVRIAFFTSNAQHRKTASRIDAFRAFGAEVEVIAFDRETFRDPGLADIAYHSLGWSTDGKNLSRAMLLPSAALRARRIARSLGEIDIVWVNALDLLALAMFAMSAMKGARRLVYDVADLRPKQLSPGLAGKLFRGVERWLCRKVEALVITSPWFYWRYYVNILPAGAPAFLYENKVSAPAPARANTPPRLPWRIVWHGLLRSRTSFGIARRLAEALPDTLEIEAWGFTGILVDEMKDAQAKLKNFHWHGPFSDSAIDHVFDGAHFIFAFDLDDGLNSMLLLPNRLYHGVSRALPVLAAAGSAIGQVVTAKGLGVEIREPYADSLIAFFRDLTPEAFRALQDGISPELSGRAVYADELQQFLADFIARRPVQALPREQDLSAVLPGPASRA